MRSILKRTHKGFEHQIEFACRGQFATALGTTLFLNGVFAKPAFTFLAIDKWVREIFYVPGSFPNFGSHKDRRIQRFDVVATFEHRVPPSLFDIMLQQRAQRTVIITAVDAAIDFAGWENESPSFAKRHQIFHDICHWAYPRL